MYESSLFDYKEDAETEEARPFSTLVLEKAVKILKKDPKVNPKKVESWVTKLEKLYFYKNLN